MEGATQRQLPTTNDSVNMRGICANWEAATKQVAARCEGDIVLGEMICWVVVC